MVTDKLIQFEIIKETLTCKQIMRLFSTVLQLYTSPVFAIDTFIYVHTIPNSGVCGPASSGSLLEM